jgi:TonB family protein
MNQMVLYIFQTGISLILLYLVYWFFLRKDTFFSINRLFLVGSAVFSLVFPLFHFTWIFQAEPASAYLVALDMVTINASRFESTLSNHLTLLQILLIVYLTGAAIFTVRFVIQLVQLLLMIKKYGISRHEGLRIVFIDSNYSPFSFFNLIFINRKQLNRENIQEIITHEQVHIRQKHSVDLILLEVMTILQWFNPFVWFYRVSLKSIHEFLADQGVLLRGFNPVDYQKLLIGQYIGIQVNDLTNNFNHSLLKKRIVMMTKSRSRFAAQMKVLMVTPVAFLLVVAFTVSPVVKTVAQVDKQTQKAETKSQSPKQETQDDIFTVVEQMPKFPGGDDARTNYLVNNIKYPDDARKAGIQGVTYVSFIVETDGSITGAKVLRGFDKACDEVAVNVIKNMPNWEPGVQRGKPVRVQFNMPIRFALGDGDKKDTKNPDQK